MKTATEIIKKGIEEGTIKQGQTFSVLTEEKEQEFKVKKANELIAEIKDIEKHIDAISNHLKILKTIENNEAPIFITIDNDCIDISGKYAPAIIRGLQNTIQDLRYGKCTIRLQLKEVLK